MDGRVPMLVENYDSCSCRPYIISPPIDASFIMLLSGVISERDEQVLCNCVNQGVRGLPPRLISLGFVTLVMTPSPQALPLHQDLSLPPVTPRSPSLVLVHFPDLYGTYSPATPQAPGNIPFPSTPFPHLLHPATRLTHPCHTHPSTFPLSHSSPAMPPCYLCHTTLTPATSFLCHTTNTPFPHSVPYPSCTLNPCHLFSSLLLLHPSSPSPLPLLLPSSAVPLPLLQASSCPLPLLYSVLTPIPCHTFIQHNSKLAILLFTATHLQKSPPLATTGHLPAFLG